jgi:UDP-N-acetylglucosamine 2-epimerase
MKLMCVVGARPNFMKAAPVIDSLRRYPDMQVLLVHTGQHYDHKMSTLFFQELGMPKPDIDLQVGSGSHGEQTGHIMMKIEPLMKVSGRMSSSSSGMSIPPLQPRYVRQNLAFRWPM